MQSVDDKPETIHLYVVREEEPKPSILPIVLSALSLIFFTVFCVLTPYQQPEVRAVIRVPAVPLSIKTFSASIKVIPTGVRTYPATLAHGILTITNGSIIGNVTTDIAVYVPAGSASGYGWAYVTAHAGNPGKNGNIPALAINNVIGSSVYVRNLTAFKDGRDAYSVKVITPQDRQTALTKARNQLAILAAGLHYPCLESSGWGVSVSKPLLSVRLRCQMYTYIVPSYMHVLGTQLQGKEVIIAVWFVQPLKRIWAK